MFLCVCFCRHYCVATVAKANGTMEYAAGEGSSWRRPPKALPYIRPRTKPENAHFLTEVCLHPSCRDKNGDRVRHGDYCNGTKPAWEAHLEVELLTPAPLMRDMLEQCRTVVLASGSLAPIPSLCAELGLKAPDSTQNAKPTVEPTPDPVPDHVMSTLAPQSERKEEQVVGGHAGGTDVRESATPLYPGARLQVTPKPLEANHVIDLKKQLLAVSIGYFCDGTPLTVNYANWTKPNFIPKLGNAIATVIESIPTGGVLVFLPSYSFLNKCVSNWCTAPGRRRWNAGSADGGSSNVWGRFEASKGRVIVEPTGGQGSFEEARDEYAETIRTTGSCILLAVFRGKMSEGISFNDANARGVLCVGIPYPNSFDRAIQVKRKYNDEQRKLNNRTDLLPGTEWYSQQAYRAIAQALGRCIRHAADYGTVILMDSRNCTSRSQAQLPKWMRHHVRNLSLQRNDPFGSNAITGGWNGLRAEMHGFFQQAAPHAQDVSARHQQQMMDRKKQTTSTPPYHKVPNPARVTPS